MPNSPVTDGWDLLLDDPTFGPFTQHYHETIDDKVDQSSDRGLTSGVFFFPLNATT